MTIDLKGANWENLDGTVRLSTETGGWEFSAQNGLRVQANISETDAEPSALVSIFGTPEALLQLADLIAAVASVDQAGISDRNCPPTEGIHTTIHSGREFPGSKTSLNIGRLDCKSDGSTDWFDDRV